MNAWIYILAAAVLVLPVAVAADFAAFAARAFWYASPAERNWQLVRWSWFAVVYKWMPIPRIRLTGVAASVDELHNGRMVAAVAAWWNELLRRRGGLMKFGARPVGAAEIESILRTLAPENEPLLRASAQRRAPHGRLAEASLALSYALARVFGQGTDTDWLREPQPIGPEDLERNDLVYNQLGLISDLADVPKEGFWREIELMSAWNRFVVRATRSVYLDQVRRWEKAEGVKMGKGVGFGGIEEGRFLDDFRELLFEHGGRFSETEAGVYAALKGGGELAEI